MRGDPRILATINGENQEAAEAGARTCPMTRRQVLLSGGIAATVIMIGVPEAQTPAAASTHPRKLIAKLSDLKVDEPFDFDCPGEGDCAQSILVKLGRQAGEGRGPDKDVAAFNCACPHQGGPLQGAYQAADKALGPCPLHLTTFDPTRHGIFIAGQPCQSLPQALPEL